MRISDNTKNRQKQRKDSSLDAFIDTRGRRLLSADTTFFVREAYKTLRTNVALSLTGVGCKKICVTSATMSEGKSTNCINLAISFAESGAKTLVIDCDMRRPVVSLELGCKKNQGLSNVLVGMCSLPDVLQETDYRNLRVICCGDVPPNPAELLASDRMKQIMRELEEDYDYIFLDTPPVESVTDTTILSQYADGVIIVARANVGRKDALANTINQLTFANAKILGFVLCAVEMKSGKYGKSYKYGKYGKYGAYGAYGAYETSRIDGNQEAGKKEES